MPIQDMRAYLGALTKVAGGKEYPNRYYQG
jgi:hypothetical protein